MFFVCGGGDHRVLLVSETCVVIFWCSTVGEGGCAYCAAAATGGEPQVVLKDIE